MELPTTALALSETGVGSAAPWVHVGDCGTVGVPSRHDVPATSVRSWGCNVPLPKAVSVDCQVNVPGPRQLESCSWSWPQGCAVTWLALNAEPKRVPTGRRFCSMVICAPEVGDTPMVHACSPLAS